MLVIIGLMVACYCIARLLLITITLPESTLSSRVAQVMVAAIVVVAIVGISYFAWALLNQATDRADRPRIEMR